MTATVTVVVPTWNRAEYLPHALDSLLTQTLPPAQVIVVDDGSTDSTPAVVAGYGGRVEYLRKANGGKSSAVNAGLARVRGEYLWVFDDDDVALPDALARFVDALDGRVEYGFAYSTCWFTLDGPDHRLGEVVGEAAAPSSVGPVAGGLLLPLLEGNFLSGAAVFARAASYRVVGGFDERLIRSQDYDMAIRLARRFAGVRVAGGPTFHQRQHSGPRGSERDRFTAAEKSAKWQEYDALVFRKVRDDLGLEEYLRPVGGSAGWGPAGEGLAGDGLAGRELAGRELAGRELAGREREALLQRFFLLAPRLPFAEVVGDLRAATALQPDAPLNATERAIVRDGVGRAVHGPSLARSPEFLDEVRRLVRAGRATSAGRAASAGRVGRSLRAEVARSLSATWLTRDWRAAASGLVQAAAGLRRLYVCGGCQGRRDHEEPP